MKAEVWIYDATGGVHDGWLELIEEAGQLRPADRGWNIVAVFPPEGGVAGTTRVVLWADQRDKYVARIDLGDLHRWIICERLPALLRTLPSLDALVRVGRS